jgi:hypothetical protein
MAVNEELRAAAQVVAHEALEIETGGLGPAGSENSGQYLDRMAATVVRHLDLADFLKDPNADQRQESRAKAPVKRGSPRKAKK